MAFFFKKRLAYLWPQNDGWLFIDTWRDSLDYFDNWGINSCVCSFYSLSKSTAYVTKEEFSPVVESVYDRQVSSLYSTLHLHDRRSLLDEKTVEEVLAKAAPYLDPTRYEEWVKNYFPTLLTASREDIIYRTQSDALRAARAAGYTHYCYDGLDKKPPRIPK